jgi:hypothetical protein
MTQGIALSLSAPPGQAFAETVSLALAARGTAVERSLPASTGGGISGGAVLLTLRREGADPLTLSDPGAILDLIEELHPDQPLLPRDAVRRAEHRQAIAAIARLAVLLDRLTRTTDQRDVDLNTHLLREQLSRLAPILATAGQTDRSFTLPDLAAAPLLWRIAALDRAHDTHLLTGFDAIRDRGIWLVRHPLVAEVLRPSILAAWLDGLRVDGALVARSEDRIDWSGALGPAGKAGNKLPPASQRTEIHSIGTEPRIR